MTLGYVNEILKVIGITEVKNPIMNPSEVDYTLIKKEFELDDEKDVVWIKLTEDGYVGVIAVSNDINFDIPPMVPDMVSDIERKAIVTSLSRSDSEDPNKIYCNKVKRNPSGRKRSEFNADKTKLLRGSLFKHFCNEPNVSFCYLLNRQRKMMMQQS